jgi:hypothetical protein
VNQPALIAAIRDHAGATGVPLSNYAVGADFRGDDLAGEIARVKQHLDTAHALGIRFFRHDVVAWAWREESQEEFEGIFDRLVQASRELADYAAPLGITTSIENHGFCMNVSERVRRLIVAVDRPNFRTTLDIGNFLCVDEDPVSAVPLNLPYASVVHLKDFYHRDFLPGDGWLTTLARGVWRPADETAAGGGEGVGVRRADLDRIRRPGARPGRDRNRHRQRQTDLERGVAARHELVPLIPVAEGQAAHSQMRYRSGACAARALPR